MDERRELARLRVEIDELRAARRRLVQAADDDRRTIERALHGGLHQQLVALAVGVQLARQAMGSDPVAARTLLEEMERDIRQALDQAALLAQRIYPAMLEAETLGALLRAVAVTAGVPASVDIAVGSSYSPDVVMTVYLCWLDALVLREQGASRVTIDVRESADGLSFDVTGALARADENFSRVRDRVEALDGRLTIGTGRGGATRVSGFLPLSR